MVDSIKAGPHEHDAAIARAATVLAELQEQAVQQRMLLARLQREVIEVQLRLDTEHVAELVEANEHLVLALLQAQSDAATGARVLNEVTRSAQLDGLTGLPNRTLLHDRCAAAIANATRRQGSVALLFLDLNNFKQINDALGHSAGDEVLRGAARALAAAVGDGDTVSRHCGDEFLILLADAADHEQAAQVAGNLITALGAPICVAEHVIRLTASIGIALCPEHGDDPETLIGLADAAMGRAKRHGRSNFAFHAEPGDDPQDEELRALESLRDPMALYRVAIAEHGRRHAQLQEANQHLVLAALSAHQLQSAAEQTQRRQSDLLALAAHELRNPLTPIRTAAALLGRVRHEELPRVQAIIERQVLHMTRLVSDLLDVSRVHTGKLRLQPVWTDMADVIDAAVETCRPAIDTRLQTFSIQMPARLPELFADPIRLVQVFSNLLDNASKYTHDGGEIRLTVSVRDKDLVFTVIDSGIGISAEVLPTVFEPFVQDTHAIGFNAAGLGIGLTVVRELVEAHGGHVAAASRGTGLGSQFVVTLPRERPAKAALLNVDA